MILKLTLFTKPAPNPFRSRDMGSIYPEINTKSVSNHNYSDKEE
jgi:hypothetical protein